MPVPDPADLRVMIPRTRRKLEGAGAPPVLADDAVKDLIADAVGAVILYTNGQGVFGKDLTVTATDPTYGAPSEYKTTVAGNSAPLDIHEQTVVTAQAALDYFFHRFGQVKVSEVIADEAQHWEYTLSAALVRDQLKLLRDERDMALDRINEENTLDSYISFTRVRDVYTSELIEPWVLQTGTAGLSLQSGMEDYNFGTFG